MVNIEQLGGKIFICETTASLSISHGKTFFRKQFFLENLPSAGAAGALKAASETAPGSAAVAAQPADGRGSC